MSEIALQKALARQAEITSALAKISADLIGIGTFLASYHKMLAIQPTSGSSVQIEQQKQRQVDRVDPLVLESVKIARIAIGAANKPLPLGVLYDDARAKGFQILSENPRGTYGARLRDHHKRIGLIFLRKFGWWLSERPYEPANYSPGTPTSRKYRAGWSVKKRLLPQVVEGNTAQA